MSFKFDINTAQHLISEIDAYSQNMQKSAVDILDILELSDSWNDNNSKKFIENNKRICEDLIKIVETEEELMRSLFYVFLCVFPCLV